MPEDGNSLLQEEEEEDFWTKLEREKQEKLRQEEESRRIIEQKKREMKEKAEAAKKAAREKALKKKSGFMTGERKKKLRQLLRKKAAEELKKEQERKAAEKKAAIELLCGQPKDLNNPRLTESDLLGICEEYHRRIQILEGQKYDLEYITKLKIYEIKDLSRKVVETRGRFQKPPMKKVPKFELTRPPIPKTELKFSKDKLKQTKKGLDFELDMLKKKSKPEWALPKDQRPKPTKKGTEEEHPAEGHVESAEAESNAVTAAE